MSSTHYVDSADFFRLQTLSRSAQEALEIRTLCGRQARPLKVTRKPWLASCKHCKGKLYGQNQGTSETTAKKDDREDVQARS